LFELRSQRGTKWRRVQPIMASNAYWRWQFRYRGSRHAGVAQLYSLIWLNNVKRAVVCFPKIRFHFPAGLTTNYTESAAGTP
jgi:hypothetical protein